MTSQYKRFGDLANHQLHFLNDLNKHSPEAYALMVNDVGLVDVAILESYYADILYGCISVTNSRSESRIFRFDKINDEWHYITSLGQ